MRLDVDSVSAMHMDFVALFLGPFEVLCTLAAVAFVACVTRTPSLRDAAVAGEGLAHQGRLGAAGASVEFELESHFARMNASRLAQPKLSTLTLTVVINFLFVLAVVLIAQPLGPESIFALVLCLATLVTSFFVLGQAASIVASFIKSQNEALLGQAGAQGYSRAPGHHYPGHQ